ncbi:MAG TPA: hypothetical protein VK186_13680 [Candidatus Deferrimicrobium sp.]|nr:hypothetical protein [Candidatus Kapabacteria bacterium]HLP59885.1 hypothetical protein [Candidatus Deferrimicrobium sp.]
MKQESKEFFCPIELIEPIAFSDEFQILGMMIVKCNSGKVCGGGEAEG